ncbi:hypothetical protein [Rhizobium sp. Root1220]|uniref:hypothetical protein n=1 Tax=Rhizobium sp. Root1220 TaxID=1736432 RepID=UPI0006FB97E2|nr:hypothetical protein [Rhizobium sp. Root1220]KQV79253.1 hypothetical protein ASC90_26400 [Rhizobium sp. Root1220]
MIDTQDAQRTDRKPFGPHCRKEVEEAMFEMIQRLQQRGLAPAEIALTLADAAEDYVMLLANKASGAH